MNTEETLRAALDVLHDDSTLVEVRPLMPDGSWWTGLFDDRERLVRSILGLNAIEAIAVYWTLNAIKPELASRVTNSVGPAKRGSCIANRDIERYRWLFLDVDNKGDRAAVDALAVDVEGFLTDKGWEPPVHVDSGTGRYLLYRVDFPVATAAKKIKAVIQNLADRFDRPGAAIIDPKCHNAGRIARVPGTFNRKGRPMLATMGVAA